jgi:hypothetical protein
MRRARFWRLAVIAAAAGGLGLAAAGPALAAGSGRSGLAVTISTASTFVQVDGSTLVRFGGSAADGTATVSGTVTGIPAGQPAVVVTLLDEPFGGDTFAAAGQQLTISRHADGTASYSFPVAASLATTYEVQATAGPATPATSAPRTVYVIPQLTVSGSTACTRPLCTIHLTVTATYPPSAFPTESAKKFYLYGDFRHSATATPAIPARLRLSGSAARSVRDAARNTVTYSVGATYNIGTGGYQWKINYCTPDTEGQDGIGLPGHHGCGDPTVSATAAYLG